MLAYGKLLDSLQGILPHNQKDLLDGFSQDAEASISMAYNEMGNLDSALYYAQIIHTDISGINGDIRKLTKLNLLGDILRKKGEDQMALHDFRSSILLANNQSYPIWPKYFKNRESWIRP